MNRTALIEKLQTMVAEFPEEFNKDTAAIESILHLLLAMTYTNQENDLLNAIYPFIEKQYNMSSYMLNTN